MRAAVLKCIRQPRRIRHPQRRDQRVIGIMAASDILREEPLHVCRGQQPVVSARRPMRCGGPVVIGDRVGQELAGDAWPARVTRPDRAGGRQVGARTLAGHDHGAVPRSRPFHSGKRIVERLWKGMVRREPIIDVDHLATRRFREPAAKRVRRGQVADHPATAVQQHNASHRLRRRAISPNGNGTMRPLDR